MSLSMMVPMHLTIIAAEVESQLLAAWPEDYLYSSARIWQGKPLDAEPLEMDIGDIDWRR